MVQGEYMENLLSIKKKSFFPGLTLLLAGFLAGHDYKKAFQTGVLAGSASAFSEELATMAEVSALLNSNKGIFKG